MSNRNIYDEAELIASRVVRYLKETSDVSTWDSQVVSRLEGAIAAYIVSALEYRQWTKEAEK